MDYFYYKPDSRKRNFIESETTRLSKIVKIDEIDSFDHIYQAGESTDLIKLGVFSRIYERLGVI